MAKDPAVLFYTSDFLTGVSTMSYENRGKYITLLCLQHQKGRLTEQDMLYICSTYVADVYNKFIKDENGFYYNKRMENETIKRVKYSASRRENIEKRYKKKGSTYVVHMENENININKDINKDINKEVVFNIVSDLNLVLGTSYKTGRKTTELINARLKEGFSVDDFKKVHRIKQEEWSKDEKMCKYLRPETLYSNKFEGYLNQGKLSKTGIKNDISGFSQESIEILKKAGRI